MKKNRLQQTQNHEAKLQEALKRVFDEIEIKSFQDLGLDLRNGHDQILGTALVIKLHDCEACPEYHASVRDNTYFNPCPLCRHRVATFESALEEKALNEHRESQEPERH